MNCFFFFFQQKNSWPTNSLWFVIYALESPSMYILQTYESLLRCLGEYRSRVWHVLLWRDYAKQTLRASSRMDEMNVSQLLGRACAIMKDGMTAEEPFMPATLLNIPFNKCPNNISCYRCSGPKHYKYRPQGRALAVHERTINKNGVFEAND